MNLIEDYKDYLINAPQGGSKTGTISANTASTYFSIFKAGLHQAFIDGYLTIDKHVTFHTARHTFATMMLTLGANLYTTSKLLGHTDVRMTQIYAKIINRKKDEAVNLVNGLFD
nr:site-specific integrase [Leyella stercorea]